MARIEYKNSQNACPRKPIWVFVLSICVIFSEATSIAPGGDATLLRNNWDKYCKRVGNQVYKVNISSGANIDSLSLSAHETVNFSNGRFVIEYQNVSRNYSYINGMNPDYCFRLKSNADSGLSIDYITERSNVFAEAKTQILRTFDLQHNRAKIPRELRLFNNFFWQDVLTNETLAGSLIYEYDSTGEILSARTGGMEYHEIRSAVEGQLTAKIRIIKATFDTTQFLLPIEFEADVQSEKESFLVKVKNTFEIVNGLPRILTCVTEFREKKGPFIQRDEFIRGDEATDLPDSRFRVLHYGLPEPTWLNEKRSSWRIWLLAIAGILTLLFGLVIFVKKRR